MCGTPIVYGAQPPRWPLKTDGRSDWFTYTFRVHQLCHSYGSRVPGLFGRLHDSPATSFHSNASFGISHERDFTKLRFCQEIKRTMVSRWTFTTFPSTRLFFGGPGVKNPPGYDRIIFHVCSMPVSRLPLTLFVANRVYYRTSRKKRVSHSSPFRQNAILILAEM
jgi:hypothetical protein